MAVASTRCGRCHRVVLVVFRPRHPWNLRCPHGDWMRTCSASCTHEVVAHPRPCSCATAVVDPGCGHHGAKAAIAAEAGEACDRLG